MHSNHSIVPYISLCSGYEGIGIGLHRVVRNLRTIAYCEREAFACENLVAKIEAGHLDAAPIFTDVCSFPWREYAPSMARGILSFGWPCQPVSVAGKRKATEDERWLFDIIADGISVMRPGILFAENVEGLLSAKMPGGSLVLAHCIERLESLGYRTTWGIFSASEVGAPHQRKRVFILADSRSAERREISEGRHVENWGHSGGEEEAGRSAQRGELAVCDGQRLEGIRTDTPEIGRENARRPTGLRDGESVWPSRPGEQQHCWEPPRVVGGMADNVKRWSNRRTDWFGGRKRESEEDVRTNGGGRGQENVLRKTQPAMGRDFDGGSYRLDDAELYESCDNRVDELRLLGNGVVPATAERAWRVLSERLGIF